MLSLYSRQAADRMGKRARTSLWTALAVLGVALAACVALCFRVRTGNAEQMLYTVIGLFTLAGWAAILLLQLVWKPSRAEYHHMNNVLSGREEEMEGRLAVSPMAFQIPKSVLIRRVTLTDGEETKTLNLNARWVKLMPANGTAVRVKTAKKFITAIEVPHEND